LIKLRFNSIHKVRESAWEYKKYLQSSHVKESIFGNHRKMSRPVNNWQCELIEQNMAEAVVQQLGPEYNDIIFKPFTSQLKAIIFAKKNYRLKI